MALHSTNIIIMAENLAINNEEDRIVSAINVQLSKGLWFYFT